MLMISFKFTINGIIYTQHNDAKIRRTAMDIKKESNIITKITISAIVFNCLLLIVKIVFGIIGKSSAVINSAVDSGLDVIVTISILFIGRFSRKKPDKSHPYGHEKFESITTIAFGIVLIVVAVQLIIGGAETLIDYFSKGIEITQPETLAIVAVIATIVVKLGLFIVTNQSYRRAKSPALKALAIDHISDVFVSIALLVGVVLALNGFVFFEPIAGILVALFIGYNGVGLIIESIGQVVDEAAEKEDINQVKELAKSVPGVIKIDKIRTRKFGLKLFVDIEISVDGNLTVDKGHDIAEAVHDLVEKEMEHVKHCMVHVNPYHE